jgi:predicted deacylase
MDIKMLLFEGGKSLDINLKVANVGVNGTKRFLNHLNMLDAKHELELQSTKSIYIEKSSWLRAKCSGLFIDNNLVGTLVTKGTVLGVITDPFGKFEQKIKAPSTGFIINANHAPIVYEGDAIYHISSDLDFIED